MIVATVLRSTESHYVILSLFYPSLSRPQSVNTAHALAASFFARSHPAVLVLHACQVAGRDREEEGQQPRAPQDGTGRAPGPHGALQVADARHHAPQAKCDSGVGNNMTKGNMDCKEMRLKLLQANTTEEELLDELQMGCAEIFAIAFKSGFKFVCLLPPYGLSTSPRVVCLVIMFNQSVRETSTAHTCALGIAQVCLLLAPMWAHDVNRDSFRGEKHCYFLVLFAHGWCRVLVFIAVATEVASSAFSCFFAHGWCRVLVLNAALQAFGSNSRTVPYFSRSPRWAGQRFSQMLSRVA